MNSFLRLGLICGRNNPNVVDTRRNDHTQNKRSCRDSVRAQQLLELGLLTKEEFKEIENNGAGSHGSMTTTDSDNLKFYKAVSHEPVKSEMKIVYQETSSNTSSGCGVNKQPTSCVTRVVQKVTVFPTSRGGTASSGGSVTGSTTASGARTPDNSAYRTSGGEEPESKSDEEVDLDCCTTSEHTLRTNSSACSSRSRVNPDHIYHNGSSSSSSSGSDNLDPITLTPLHGVLYHYRTPCGNRTVTYNISSIVRYIHRTGELRDPVTRNALTDDDLQQIDSIVAGSEIHRGVLPSVLSVKDPSHREVYEKESRNSATVAGLEACLGEIIVEILETVESARGKFSLQNAEMKLPLLFSQFDLPFAELKQLSIEAAYQSHKRWHVFLVGPAKRPTQDYGGILTATLDMLDSHWSSEDQRQLLELRHSTLLQCDSFTPSSSATPTPTPRPPLHSVQSNSPAAPAVPTAPTAAAAAATLVSSTVSAAAAAVIENTIAQHHQQQGLPPRSADARK